MTRLTRTAKSRLQTWANVSKVQSDEQAYGLEMMMSESKTPRCESLDDGPDCADLDHWVALAFDLEEDLAAALAERDALAAQVAEVEADARRLDFVLDRGSFITKYGTLYQLWEQDEDEAYHVLSGDGRWFGSPRAAIDAAMAALSREEKS